MQYEWLNNVAKMSSDYTIIHFHDIFNQKIEPNTLPEKLTTLTFGWHFDQKIDSEMLPSNLKKINFIWIFMHRYDSAEIGYRIEMVNNILNYYHVMLLLKRNIFGTDDDGPKWPIHVVGYRENKWSPNIYEIQDKYIHPIYGSITVIINKNTFQPYSSNKSALK